VNIKEIKEMINLMNENGLSELEVEKEDMRIRLKKTANGIEGVQLPLATLFKERFQQVPKRKMSSRPKRKLSLKLWKLNLRWLVLFTVRLIRSSFVC